MTPRDALGQKNLHRLRQPHLNVLWSALPWGRAFSGPFVLASFGAIVFTLGAAAAGVELASKNFILEFAPDEQRRPVYIGVNDTLIAVPTMLLVIGGAVIDRAGFQLVFAAVAVCSVLAGLMARALPAARSRRPSD